MLENVTSRVNCTPIHVDKHFVLPFIHLPIYRSVDRLSVYLFMCLFIHLSTNLCVYV